MKTLIIAEKPSLALEIKNMLSQQNETNWSKKPGYFESSKYLLTYFFGHLLTAHQPDEYNNKWKGRWDLKTLPILPEALKFHYK